MQIKELLKEIKKRSEKDKEYLNRDVTLYTNYHISPWEYEIKWIDCNIEYWITFYL